ncbi:MAG: lamin tail domain-containing protein [Candidatus Methanomethylophilaceae archaeon]|nr:lamin tail domain-containing protein [Candidatus Methanomethylophilaceae archaeon]
MERPYLQLMFVLALLVVPLVPSVSDMEGASGDSGVRISEFYSYGTNGVTLTNYGNSSVDLRDYSIKDSSTGGEGSVTFTQKLTLSPGKSVMVCSTKIAGDPFSDRAAVITDGQKGVDFSKNFVLARNGDDIYLYKGSSIIDAVCYGKTVISNTDLWKDTFAAPSKEGYVTYRYAGTDTDSSDDWKLKVPGRTDLAFDPNLKYDAEVTPFLFPESGGVPVYRALESAKDSVFIQIYEMTNIRIYSLLIYLESKGVDVTVMVEGAPVEGFNQSQAFRLKALQNAGGEVLVIGATKDPDRYDLNHAKFAIVDDSTVIVTSENWTADNMNGTVRSISYADEDHGNRGWGAIVKSTGYAGFMKDVFVNDSSDRYDDVRTFDEFMPYAASASIGSYESPDTTTVFPSYKAQVTPFLSPDNSYAAQSYYISNADERVYVQQQSLGSSYQNLSDSSPVMMLSQAASRGADARFILGSTYNTDTAEKQVGIINSMTAVKAATMEVPKVHNKGLVVDDVAIVTSVNWTDNAFNQNREVGVAIHSKAVSDFFADAFIGDFTYYYTYEGFFVDVSGIPRSIEYGKDVKLTVGVPKGDYEFEWDLGDGSKTIKTNIPAVAVRPAQGAHVLTVKVTSSDGITNTAKVDYYVGSESQTTDQGDDSGQNGSSDSSEGFLSGSGGKLIPIIVVILAIIIMVARRVLK